MAGSTGNSRLGSPAARRGGLCALSVFLLGACSLPLPPWGARPQLEVVLPPSPDAWKPFGKLSYLLVLPPEAAGGEARTLQWDAGGPPPRLSLAKRCNLPLLAYPLLAGRSDLLKPAGALYPISLDERGRLRFSFRDGFLAGLLFPLSGETDLLASINASRLGEEIWERSQGDPWIIDRERILKTLAYGTMRSDRITPLPAYDLTIRPVTGGWISADPFRAPVEAEDGAAALALGSLPLGVHHLLRAGPAASGGAAPECLDIEVSGTGWLWMDSITGDGGDGRW